MLGVPASDNISFNADTEIYDYYTVTGASFDKGNEWLTAEGAEYYLASDIPAGLSITDNGLEGTFEEVGRWVTTYVVVCEKGTTDTITIVFDVGEGL